MSIKLEDLKDQAALDKVIADAVREAVGELDGLKNKRNELIAAAKTLKEDHAKVINEKDDEIESLKADNAKKLEGNDDYRKLFEQAKEQHEKENSQLKKDLEAERSVTQKLLVSDTLSRELAGINVNPDLLESAVDILSKDVVVVEDNGSRVAKVGDKGIKDFVTDWSQSTVGKHFILAKENGGGGANGNDNPSAGKWAEFEAHFKGDTWNLTEQAKLAKVNPEAYAALHKQYPVRKVNEQAA